MPDYRRRLPHFHPQDAYVFLTWRLWGTLPLRVDSAARPTAGHAFVAQDRAMDRCAVGPLWLQNPYIANLVAEAILIGQGERRFYELCAWVVMPNHCSSAHPSPGSHCGTDALAEGIDLAERQPNPGADRAAVLAGRVFRSLPARFEADRANRRIYRGQPGFSRLGALGGMLAVVQRGLAGETACPTKPPRRSNPWSFYISVRLSARLRHLIWWGRRFRLPLEFLHFCEIVCPIEALDLVGQAVSPARPLACPTTAEDCLIFIRRTLTCS